MIQFENLSEFNSTVYRNIYTIETSQDLFDDLISINNNEANKVLRKYEEATSGISHTVPPKNRVFDYSQPPTISIGNVFSPPYGKGRFGDGNGYGVWYSAIEEETSIKEAFFHQWRFAQEQLTFYPEIEFVTIDRRMFSCEVSSKRALDLRKYHDLYHKLTSGDYTFCNELGKKINQAGIELLITPSARNDKGYCVPVFSSEVIKKEQTIYYLKFYIYRNGRAKYEKISHIKKKIDIPKSWKNESNSAS